MNLLAFDTCLDKTYITLYNGEKFDNRVILSDEKSYHSAYLISAIVDVLKSNKLTPKDLTCIATDIGPGSFTGIRACVTVARMLAQQLNIKVVGVSSLEILSKILDGNDIVALDARKNKAYLYDNKILGAIDLEQTDEIVKGKQIITDDNLYDRFKSFSDVVSYQQSNYKLGEILAKIAVNKEQVEWGNLKPLYIQPPGVNLSALKK